MTAIPCDESMATWQHGYLEDSSLASSSPIMSQGNKIGGSARSSSPTADRDEGRECLTLIKDISPVPMNYSRNLNLLSEYHVTNLIVTSHEPLA
jgi:hypothetical protein